jgi:hypothetical protein
MPDTMTETIRFRGLAGPRLARASVDRIWRRVMVADNNGEFLRGDDVEVDGNWWGVRNVTRVPIGDVGTIAYIEY